MFKGAFIAVLAMLATGPFNGLAITDSIQPATRGLLRAVAMEPRTKCGTSGCLGCSSSCGKAEQRCCSQAGDGSACGSGLACDRSTGDSTNYFCKPCGAEGQLACNPKDCAHPSPLLC